MKFIKNLGNALLKNEQGYGTVELLLIIAALGLLATGIMGDLKSKLTTNASGTGATDKVTSNISTMLDSWSH